MKYGQCLNPHKETYTLTLYKIKSDSAFEYESKSYTFKCKPANNKEKKVYRITKGVSGINDGVFLVCSNLPDIAEIGDKVKFNGTTMTIQSIGYYYQDLRIANGGIFNDEYIKLRMPKGLVLG